MYIVENNFSKNIIQDTLYDLVHLICTCVISWFSHTCCFCKLFGMQNRHQGTVYMYSVSLNVLQWPKHDFSYCKYRLGYMYGDITQTQFHTSI